LIRRQTVCYGTTSATLRDRATWRIFGRVPRLAILASLALFLALPASASAVEIGSDHSGSTGINWSCDNGPGAGAGCFVYQEKELGDFNVNVVPSAGRITGFAVRDASGPFRFRVFRSSGPVGQSAEVTGQAGLQGYTLTPAIPVQAGDFIAIELGDTSAIGVRDASAEAGTNLFETTLAGDPQDVDNNPFELFLSATFVPNSTPPPFVPPVNNPVVPATPDPLAALRAGKRPTARIAGGTVKISKRGVGSLSITNPNGYALKGTLSLAAGKLKLGKARVSLRANATKAFKFKLSRKALRRLRKKRRLRALATAKLKGPIGKTGTIRKRVTLKAPAKPKRKRRRPAGGGPTSNLWLARNGNTGAYDDFKFRLEGGNINLTGTSLLFVSCFEIGGSYRSAFSYEVFNLLGPWRLGNQTATQQRRSRAVNTLVSSSERTITYTVKSSRSGNRITGERKMSFSDSQYDPFTNTISSIFCSGTQKYEAIPG
jgi:hypothetical protein